MHRHGFRSAGLSAAAAATALAVFLVGPRAPAAQQAERTLDIYFIDVEGGQATLYVSPSGQSMLVDAGYPGFGGRDAGRFRMINLGDLSWNQEYGLVCPTNRIGTVDVLLATQHGDEETGSPAFVYVIRPKAVMTNNGPRKSVIQPLIRTVRASPRPMDLWQLHHSLLGDQLNVAEPFIANVGDADAGHWLKLSARRDGSFAVTNGRTGYTKAYAAGD